jgi:hypothetical protein
VTISGERVFDRQGKFIPDLKKRDFHIYEDGVEQEIAEFGAVEVPFQRRPGSRYVTKYNLQARGIFRPRRRRLLNSCDRRTR